MKWAFSDESRRGNRYCVVAVVVATHAVNDARKTIDGFRKPRQRRQIEVGGNRSEAQKHA